MQISFTKIIFVLLLVKVRNQTCFDTKASWPYLLGSTTDQDNNYISSVSYSPALSQITWGGHISDQNLTPTGTPTSVIGLFNSNDASSLWISAIDNKFEIRSVSFSSDNTFIYGMYQKLANGATLGIIKINVADGSEFENARTHKTGWTTSMVTKTATLDIANLFYVTTYDLTTNQLGLFQFDMSLSPTQDSLLIDSFYANGGGYVLKKSQDGAIFVGGDLQIDTNIEAAFLKITTDTLTPLWTYSIKDTTLRVEHIEQLSGVPNLVFLGLNRKPNPGTDFILAKVTLTDGAPSAKQLRAISLPIAGATVIELTVLGMYADSENILYTFARQITDVNASERYGSGAMFITDFSGTQTTYKPLYMIFPDANTPISNIIESVYFNGAGTGYYVGRALQYSTFATSTITVNTEYSVMSSTNTKTQGYVQTIDKAGSCALDDSSLEQTFDSSTSDILDNLAANMPVYSNSNGQSSRINLSTSTLDSVALSTVLYQKTWCIPQDVIYTITPTTQPNVNWNVVNGDLAYTIAEFTLAETCADLVWTYSFYGDVLLNGIPDVSHPFTISGNTISAIVNNALIGNVYSITLKGMIPNQQFEVSAQFTITVVSLDCNTNVLTIVTPIEDSTYIISSGNTVFTPTITQSIPECVIVYSLQEGNSGTYDNTIITAFDTTTGSITLSTTDKIKHGTVWTLQVTATTGGTPVTEEFLLTFHDSCNDAVLSGPTFDSTSLTWDLYQSQIIQFSPMSDSIGNCGQYSYVIKLVSDDSELGTTIFTINTDDPSNPYISGTPSDLSWVGTHNWYIEGSIVDGTIIYPQTIVSTNQLENNIINPCLTATFQTPNEIREMSSSLFGTPDQVTFSEAKDSASLAYGDGSGTDLCGTRSYAITEGDSVTAVSSQYLTLTSNTFNLYSENQAYIGTHEIWLTITLDDYPSNTQVIKFNAIIEPCAPTITTVPTLSDQVYLLGGAALEISFSSYAYTPIGCALTFNYEAFIVADNGSLSTLITPPFTLIGTSLFIEAQADALDLIGSYRINLHATLNDDASTSDKTVFVNVYISNTSIDCQNDKVSITGTGIQDFTYQIKTDGDYSINPLFTNSINGCLNSYALTGTYPASLITSFNQNTGVLVINADDDISLHGNTYSFSLTVTSLLSTMPTNQKQQTDTFQITLNDECIVILNAAIAGAFVESRQTVELFFETKIYIIDMIESSNGLCGTPKYSFLDASLDSISGVTQIDDYFSITFSDIQLVNLSPLNFYVASNVGNYYESPGIISNPITITFINPCEKATISIKTLESMTYMISESEQTQNIFISINPSGVCGNYRVSFRNLDGELNDFEFLTYQDNMIYLYTADTDSVGLYVIMLQVKLDNYDIEISVPFQITIKANNAPYFEEQPPFSLQFVLSEQFSFSLGDPIDDEGNLIFYIINYYDQRGNEIEPFLTFNEKLFSFESDENNLPSVGNYVLEITLYDNQHNNIMSTEYQINIKVVYGLPYGENDITNKPKQDDKTTQPEQSVGAVQDSVEVLKQNEAEQKNIEPKPAITKLSNTGMLFIGFNKPLIVPQNYKQLIKQEWRSLQETQNVLNLYLKPGLGQEVKYIDFKWKIVKFQPLFAQFQLDFEYPTHLSTAEEPEQLIVEFLGGTYFKDQEGLHVKNGTVLVKEVKRQTYPESVERIESFSNWMNTPLMISICLAVIFVVIWNQKLIIIWILIDTLQIIAHLQLINVNIPGNANFFLQYLLQTLRMSPWLKSTIDRFNENFQTLTVFESDSDWWKFINSPYNTQFEQSEYNSMLLLPNCGYLLILFGFAFLLAASILIIAKLIKQKIRLGNVKGKRFVEFLNYIGFANMLIRFLMLACIELLLGSALMFVMMQSPYEIDQNTRSIKFQKLLTFIIIGVYIYLTLITAIFTCLFIYNYKTKELQPQIKNQIKTLWLEQTFTYNCFSCCLPFLFFVRRALYVFVLTFWVDRPLLQILSCLFLSTILMLFYSHTKPYAESYITRLQIFNEFMVFIVTSHLLCFTQWMQYGDFVSAQEVLGQSLIAFVFLTFIINFYHLIEDLLYPILIRINGYCYQRKKKIEIEINEEHFALPLEKIDEVSQDEEESVGRKGFFQNHSYYRSLNQTLQPLNETILTQIYDDQIPIIRRQFKPIKVTERMILKSKMRRRGSVEGLKVKNDLLPINDKEESAFKLIKKIFITRQKYNKTKSSKNKLQAKGSSQQENTLNVMKSDQNSKATFAYKYAKKQQKGKVVQFQRHIEQPISSIQNSVSSSNLLNSQVTGSDANSKLNPVTKATCFPVYEVIEKVKTSESPYISKTPIVVKRVGPQEEYSYAAPQVRSEVKSVNDYIEPRFGKKIQDEQKQVRSALPNKLIEQKQQKVQNQEATLIEPAIIQYETADDQKQVLITESQQKSSANMKKTENQDQLLNVNYPLEDNEQQLVGQFDNEDSDSQIIQAYNLDKSLLKEVQTTRNAVVKPQDPQVQSEVQAFLKSSALAGLKGQNQQTEKKIYQNKTAKRNKPQLVAPVPQTSTSNLKQSESEQAINGTNQSKPKITFSNSLNSLPLSQREEVQDKKQDNHLENPVVKQTSFVSRKEIGTIKKTSRQQNQQKAATSNDILTQNYQGFQFVPNKGKSQQSKPYIDNAIEQKVDKRDENDLSSAFPKSNVPKSSNINETAKNESQLLEFSDDQLMEQMFEQLKDHEKIKTKPNAHYHAGNSKHQGRREKDRALLDVKFESETNGDSDSYVRGNIGKQASISPQRYQLDKNFNNDLQSRSLNDLHSILGQGRDAGQLQNYLNQTHLRPTQLTNELVYGLNNNIWSGYSLDNLRKNSRNEDKHRSKRSLNNLKKLKKHGFQTSQEELSDANQQQDYLFNNYNLECPKCYRICANGSSFCSKCVYQFKYKCPFCTRSVNSSDFVCKACNNEMRPYETTARKLRFYKRQDRSQSQNTLTTQGLSKAERTALQSKYILQLLSQGQLPIINGDDALTQNRRYQTIQPKVETTHGAGHVRDLFQS